MNIIDTKAHLDKFIQDNYLDVTFKKFEHDDVYAYINEHVTSFTVDGRIKYVHEVTYIALYDNMYCVGVVKNMKLKSPGYVAYKIKNEIKLNRSFKNNARNITKFIINFMNKDIHDVVNIMNKCISGLCVKYDMETLNVPEKIKDKIYEFIELRQSVSTVNDLDKMDRLFHILSSRRLWKKYITA